MGGSGIAFRTRQHLPDARKKHFDNLAVFVEYAREHDYGGMIETSWSTSGTYGYWFDNGYEILSMQPVRLVYRCRHSGFSKRPAAKPS